MTRNITHHSRAARPDRIRSGAALPRPGFALRVAPALLALLAFASPAWAVQAHGGAEGLVTHQLGHLLFTAGMGYLLFRLSRANSRGPGWRAFRLFLWLMIAWNAVTFAGHWMNEHADAASYVRDGAQIVAYRIGGPWDALFYATRLDHLLLVPAFAALILALRTWSREP